MAQVITKCRLTGHYMFMGMDAESEAIHREFRSLRTEVLSVLCMRAFLA